MPMAHLEGPGRVLLGALVLALWACTDPVDRAAKKRIFSPEEPAKARRAASEPIASQELARDSGLAFRVLTMSAAEAFERIGPYRYSASASFEWELGKDKVRLSETRALDQASESDFSLRTDNDRDQGLEIVRLGDQTFAKAKYRKFRERRRDRGRSELIREDAFGALKSAESMLNNRLGVAPDGEESVNGRAAKRYLLVLTAQPLRERSTRDTHLPPVQFPSLGPDPSTKRRLDFDHFRSPRRADGRLWVDVDTGVPLKAELVAQVSAPSEVKDEATLTLKIRSELKPSSAITVQAPKDFLPDEDRPSGIARTLERFELGRPDAGAATEVRSRPSPEPDEGEEP